MSARLGVAHDRASLLWVRLAGMFGGDAVVRKFGEEPPPEWSAAISRLRDFELERGLRRLAFSGRDGLPSLPAFLRLCRIPHDATDDDAQRPAGAPSQALPTHQGDRWDVAAGRHLLGHILRLSARGQHLASPRMLRTHPMPEPDADSRELVAPLVRGKNAWAQAMREAEAAGTVPADNGAALWGQCMAVAERDVARVRARLGIPCAASAAGGIAL